MSLYNSQERKAMKYPYVIEKAKNNYAGFFIDASCVATANTKEELKEKLSRGLAIYILEARKYGQHPSPTPEKNIDLSEYGISLDNEGVELGYTEPASINPTSLAIDQAIKAVGITEAEVARRMGTSRSALSRITDPFYWGHTMTMLKKFADSIGAKIEVSFPIEKTT